MGVEHMAVKISGCKGIWLNPNVKIYLQLISSLTSYVSVWETLLLMSWGSYK